LVGIKFNAQINKNPKKIEDILIVTNTSKKNSTYESSELKRNKEIMSMAEYLGVTKGVGCSGNWPG